MALPAGEQRGGEIGSALGAAHSKEPLVPVALMHQAY